MKRMTDSRYVIDSIKIIQANQASTGAYVASPAFEHYRYSWLRDGTFIAYSMDVVGEHESARRFYEWCRQILHRYEPKARAVIKSLHTDEQKPQQLPQGEFLHTRYTIEGEEVEGEWGSFQMDGYGTWLWGLAQHVRLTGQPEILHTHQKAIEITVDYLAACWRLPNYDCWEEFGDRVHPATLAAIWGGLNEIAPFFPERSRQIASLCEQIREYVLTQGVADGMFSKSSGIPAADASLLWMSLPFGLVETGDPRMEKTVQAIEQELLKNHGVHRYAKDTYYGGGQWILLSAWLGWFYAKTGKLKKAKAIQHWIESKFTDKGLPEQVQDHLLAPDMYDPWVQKAGLPANPLLWSHAMYLILSTELGRESTR